MAGLAALLSFGSDRTTTRILEALSDALAPRGSDEAMVEYGAVRLLARAALPKVHESDGVVVVVDGVAEISGLLDRYSSQGPSGLLHGAHPYALIAADPDGVALARHLDGPALYYARARGAVVVASEPAALLAAGVPAAPNGKVVARYADAGTCDETSATFFDGVRRVLPGQVVEVRRHPDSGWMIRAHPAKARPPGRVTARMALLGALGEQRTGMVLLGAGQPDIAVPTAALLATALSVHPAMPVYAAAWPGPVPVRHRVVPFATDSLDIDGFLDAVGEPMPGLADYLHWVAAKASGGEADVLVSAAGWLRRAGHLSRLDDRMSARYGVGLRFPLRDLDDGSRPELLAVAERALPPTSVEAMTSLDMTSEPPLREVLHGMRADIAAALLYPSVGEPDRAALALLSRPATAKQHQLDRLWRLYLLQRWFSTVTRPVNPQPRARSKPPRGDITSAGQTWQRRLIGVEPLAAGDRFADKIAWYVAEFGNTAGRHVWRLPWLLLVAAKPVAVAQGHAHPVWEVEPGRLARTVVRLTGDRIRHRDPWSMQVAIDMGGRLAVPAAALTALLTRSGEYPRKLAGRAATVSPPREHACPPSHLSVIGPLTGPDAAAQEIINGLRRALPDETFDTLRGCAIVRADADTVEPLGWAGTRPPPMDLIERLCQDNPFGQSDERTPLLVALAMPRRHIGTRRPPRR